MRTIGHARPLVGLVALLMTLASPFGVGAESTYPNRPIRMLVGFTPAGPTDLTARLAAQHLSEAFGQQVIVDNRPGGGGTIAGNLLARAEPDGYTLALGSGGEIAIRPNLLRAMAYDPIRDFAPISRIGAGQLVLLVHPSVAARTTSELIALAKAKPGSINFASSGNGSTAHLSSELLKHLAGIDIVHVPYKGAAPAMNDLMAGQVHMLITGYSGAVPHIKSGKLRAIGVTGSTRLPAAPELPTIAETVKGYEVLSWYGIFAPARTPQAIVSRLHRELAAMVKRPVVIERLIALGIEPEGSTPEVLARQVKEETARWARIIKIAKVPVE